MNKPIKQIGLGQYQVSVWENEPTAKIPYKTKSIQLSKSWQNEKQVWESRKISLSINDIPKVELLLREIYRDILLSSEIIEEQSDKPEYTPTEQEITIIMKANKVSRDEAIKLIKETKQ